MELKDRFLKYVSFDTQSDESSETFPSTAKQRVLLDYLAEEMKALGLTEVTVDKYGYAMGTIPATPGCEKAPVISKDRAMSALKPHIGRGADVLTDGAPAYVKPLAELGANLTQTDADDHAINRVNTLHARLEDFMFGFHGVSTKYLQTYLDWFQWLGAFTDGCGDTGDDRLLARQLGNGLYRIRRRDYQRMVPPYMDYWQKAA